MKINELNKEKIQNILNSEEIRNILAKIEEKIKNKCKKADYILDSNKIIY